MLVPAFSIKQRSYEFHVDLRKLRLRAGTTMTQTTSTTTSTPAAGELTNTARGDCAQIHSDIQCSACAPSHTHPPSRYERDQARSCLVPFAQALT